MAHNDILLHICSLFSQTQRNFFPQWIRTNIETHSQTLYRVRDLGTLSPKLDVSIKALCSELKES